MKKNKISFLALITAVALLQSCAINKKNKEVDLSLNQLDEKHFSLKDSSEIVLISYQDFFKDEALIKLIQEVLQKNNDLTVASENLKGSEALLKATKLNFLPNVNLQLSPSIQRLSKNSMMGGFAENLTYQDYTVAPNVSWEIDLWGKLKGERKEATALYLAQAEGIRALKIQLITQTASVYYNLIYLNAQSQEINQLIKLAGESVDLIQQQYNYGDASAIALKQAKDQVLELENTLVDLNQSIKNQENTLSTLLGKYPESFDTKKDIKNYNFSLSKDSKIEVAQLKNRPDVKRAELALQAANARVGINNAALYPSLTISAQGGLNSITSGNIFNVPASLFGNLAGSLTQPLFNKRQLKSNLENAIHLREASISTFKQEVVKSVAEVTDALNNLTFLEQKQVINNDKLSNLENIMADAQKLYKYGEITYLEVLSIQQLYIQAQLNNLQLHRNTIEANINFYKAIGG